MNGKNILIIGANGMLGSSLMNGLKEESVIGLKDVDITDAPLLRSELIEIKPKVIIHAAAMTDVEECETKIDEAFKVNVVGTQNIVNYCVDKDILLVYISSTGVYGCEKSETYTEFDDPYPTTVHHKTKFIGEKHIQNHLNKYLIVRTGWLFGGEKHHKKNFVNNRLMDAKNNTVIYSDNTQIGNPTYVNDLVKQIILLIKSGQYGVFNCVNSASEVSRYEYVKEIVKLGKEECEVKIAPDNYFKRCALVSNNESAENYKLSLLGLNVMRCWKSALADYVESLL